MAEKAEKAEKTEKDEKTEKTDRKTHREVAQKEKASGIKFSVAVPARVEELIGRTGTRGEAMQVRCKVLDGRDKNRILRRNVMGPVQKGDILMLRETEFEARPLNRVGRT